MLSDSTPGAHFTTKGFWILLILAGTKPAPAKEGAGVSDKGGFPAMFTHEDVWRAIDLLAERHGLSTSALARKAGLDATSFNRSKRVTTNGRPRWPSSESLAKVLRCTNTSLAEFTLLMSGSADMRLELPITDLAAPEGLGQRFDETGRPAGAEWRSMPCPGMDDAGAFALRIRGDGFLPVYRDGDVLIASVNVPARPGDRIILALGDGRGLLMRLQEQTPQHLMLHPLTAKAQNPIKLETARIAWIARILWATQ